MKYEDYAQVLKDLETADISGIDRLLFHQEIIYRMHVIEILKEFQVQNTKIQNESIFLSQNMLLINLLNILAHERRMTRYTDYASAARQNTSRNQLYEVLSWIQNDMPSIHGLEQRDKIKQYIKVFFVTWENFRECLVKITGGFNNEAK